MLYQNLFSTYSRLGLSVPSDRPVAIDSLQRRILAALNVKGGFGIFDGQHELGQLRRTLLWCRDRGSSTKFDRIAFPPDRVASVPPTWSWMAHSGVICYINVPFGEIVWDTRGDLHSPWSENVQGTPEYTGTHGVSRPTLRATAWEYSTQDEEGVIIPDYPETFESTATWCIVLGKEYGRASPSVKKHYVLIVAARDRKPTDKGAVFERVGAGWLLGRCINDSDPRVVNVC